jgi:Tfp pilus assembly protein PilF
MVLLKASAIAVLSLATVLCHPIAMAQSESDASSQASEPPSALDLTPEKVSHLRAAVAVRDYISAEKLLLEEIDKDPHSSRAAHLLAYIGSVYFLNHDYLNAAIAWKKSDAIVSLDPNLQFSLAMAYLQLSHSDWARKVLESLSAHDSKNALYVYWLGRLDYDAHLYTAATNHFRQAIALDPGMARAYDNLGLCYFYQNENTIAIENFKKAIELDRNSLHPSPWPYLNLAITLEFLGRTAEAETNLRESLRLDPQFAAAHYHLGEVLRDRGQLEGAITELKEAARLNDKYAEPHIELAHVYSRLGRREAAQEEVKIYLRLHKGSQDSGAQPQHP